MTKRITGNQILGEIGETAVKRRFLEIGFQFDVRGRLEAGIDGIAEVMEKGRPLARMIGVQVKSTKNGKYSGETDTEFTYLLNLEDLEYWRPSNLPVIIVLFREQDESLYWQHVEAGFGRDLRKLNFDKRLNKLDRSSVDRLANLTVPKNGFGHYVPPLGDGEEALVNMLPIRLPESLYVSGTQMSAQKAVAKMQGSDAPRFDWIINGSSLWSFSDPQSSSIRDLVESDQIDAVDTSLLSQHEDLTETNNFAYLLRQTLRHQERKDLGWSKKKSIFYFSAEEKNQDRDFFYESSQNRTSANVVNVVRKKDDKSRVDFVRHHAFVPRFERFLDEWFLIVLPTYHFTQNGFVPHTYPDALLAGKKRLDKNAALRGQLIMWHRFLTREPFKGDLFTPAEDPEPKPLVFGEPPCLTLPTKVPEDVWNSKDGAVAADADSSFQEFNLGEN